MAGRKGKILHVHGIDLSSLVLSIRALNTLYVWSKEYLHFTPLRLSTPSLSAWLTLLFSRPTVKNENRKHFKRLWYKCHSHEIYYFSLDGLRRVRHVSPPPSKKRQIMVLTGQYIISPQNSNQLHPTSLLQCTPSPFTSHVPPVLDNIRVTLKKCVELFQKNKIRQR